MKSVNINDIKKIYRTDKNIRRPQIITEIDQCK